VTGVRNGYDSKDKEDCVALWLEAIAGRDGEVDAETVGAWATKKFSQEIVRFGVLGDEPMAFALTVASPSNVPDSHDGSARIELLAVKPGTAGRGYGRMLLLDAIESARDAGYTRIDLEVRRGNAAALALYTSAGFKPLGPPQEHPLGGEPMLTLAMNLS
jgi:ribosomal protein S18 acetylase RimI-like enzyme